MKDDTMQMHAPGATTSSVAIRYGIIVGIISVIYSLILFMTEQDTNKWLSFISTIFLIVGIVLAHKHFKRENTGFMSYGQGLGIGSLMSAIVGLLTGIFMYIYIKFIDATYLERIKDKQLADMESKGMSDEQIEQAMSISSGLMSPEMMVVWAVVGTLFFGFILSLIISAITKNTRSEFE